MISDREVRKSNPEARRLPPLTALRAFEAAARLMSFRQAAEELHVTPAAVSQQIKTLEDVCGQALFRRSPQGLTLTSVGRAAAPLLTEGFDRLAEGVEVLRPAIRSRLLTVSVAPSFGAKWLLPRLQRFRGQHPEFDVRLDSNDRLANFKTDGVDLAIRYGSGEFPGLLSDRFLEESAFPVCTPALMAENGPLMAPADLARHTLLHVDWDDLGSRAVTWEMWLRAAGVKGVDASRGPRFTADAMAVQAAIDGVGVALVSSAVVADDLAARRLVRPFPPTEHERTNFCYYLVRPPANDRDPKVKAFRDWMLQEASVVPRTP